MMLEVKDFFISFFSSACSFARRENAKKKGSVGLGTGGTGREALNSQGFSGGGGERGLIEQFIVIVNLNSLE